MSDTPTEIELIQIIRETIVKLETCRVVDLGHFAFDRIPCSRRVLYFIVRKHAQEWGYDYNNSEYIPSGNRAFQRNHKRGRYRHPSIVRRTK